MAASAKPAAAWLRCRQWRWLALHLLTSALVSASSAASDTLFPEDEALGLVATTVTKTLPSTVTSTTTATATSTTTVAPTTSSSTVLFNSDKELSDGLEAVSGPVAAPVSSDSFGVPAPGPKSLVPNRASHEVGSDVQSTMSQVFPQQAGPSGHSTSNKPSLSSRRKQLGGFQCDGVKEAHSDDVLPPHCRKTDVKAECKNLAAWQKFTDAHNAGGCTIDPKTHQMNCSQQAKCSGGSRQQFQITEVVRNLTYNCGASCPGALLIDCCETCESYQGTPGELQVDAVTCAGCTERNRELAADSDDCMLGDGEFSCNSVGSCASGVVETTCEERDVVCEVVPCSNCTDGILRAQCCAGCLERTCKATAAERIHCEGCSVLPQPGIFFR